MKINNYPILHTNADLNRTVYVVDECVECVPLASLRMYTLIHPDELLDTEYDIVRQMTLKELFEKLLDEDSVESVECSDTELAAIEAELQDARMISTLANELGI